MKTLKQLLEDANKEPENEDGTAADLGAIPTGHANKEIDKEEANEA